MSEYSTQDRQEGYSTQDQQAGGLPRQAFLKKGAAVAGAGVLWAVAGRKLCSIALSANQQRRTAVSMMVSSPLPKGAGSTEAMSCSACIGNRGSATPPTPSTSSDGARNSAVAATQKSPGRCTVLRSEARSVVSADAAITGARLGLTPRDVHQMSRLPGRRSPRSADADSRCDAIPAAGSNPAEPPGPCSCGWNSIRRKDVP